MIFDCAKCYRHVQKYLREFCVVIHGMATDACKLIGLTYFDVSCSFTCIAVA